MDRNSSIKRNFAYNVVYQIFTILMPLVTAPYLARIIGVTGLGMYSYTFTIAEYFVYFAMLGVANYGNRTIAATDSCKRSKVFIEIYSVQLFTSITALIFYLIFAIFINTKYSVLTFIQTFYVMSSVLDITWYFFGTEKFKFTTIRNITIKLISLLSIFIFVHKAEDVWKYTLIMALGYFLSQAIMWIYLLREIKYEIPNSKNMLIHFKSMLILFIPVIAVTLYKMMDKLMLEWIGNVDEVGFYESAEKIVRVPALVVTALGTSMLPRMSKLGANNEKNKMLSYFNLSIEFSGFLTFGMACLIFSIANYLIPLYYGSDFAPSIILLQALSFTLYFTSWSSAIRTQYLLPLKHDMEYIISVFLGAITNILLNTVLISKFGALGAVIATICAEAIVAISQSLAVKKELNLIKPLGRYLLFMVPSIVTIFFVNLMMKFVDRSIISLLLCSAVGGLIYFVICIIIMYITKSKLMQSGLKTVKRFIGKERV